MADQSEAKASHPDLKDPTTMIDQVPNLTSIFGSLTEFAIIAHDLEGVIRSWNEGAHRIYGYDETEIVGKTNISTLYDPEDVRSGRAQQILTEASRIGLWRGELKRVKRDHSSFLAQVTVSPWTDLHHSHLGYVVISRPLTPAEHDDRQLRESQEYNRGLIESNIDALITTDPLGIITDVNRQMCDMTGVDREVLVGTRFKDYFTDAQRAEDGIRQVLAEDRVTNYELVMRSKSGQETVVSYNATTFRTADGKLKGVFAAARDITDQKRLEEAPAGAKLHPRFD